MVSGLICPRLLKVKEFKDGFWVNMALAPESESVPRAVYGLIWPSLQNQKVKEFNDDLWVNIALAPKSLSV